MILVMFIVNCNDDFIKFYSDILSKCKTTCDSNRYRYKGIDYCTILCVTVV